MRQLFLAEWKLLKRSRIYVISSIITFLLYSFFSLFTAFFAPEVSRYSLIFFYAFCFFYVWFVFFWPDEQNGSGRMKQAMTKYERLICLAETKRSYYISRLLCIFFLLFLGIIFSTLLQLPFLLDSVSVFLAECKASAAIVIFNVSILSILCILFFDKPGYLYMLIFGFYGGACGFTFSKMEKEKHFEDKIWMVLIVLALLLLVIIFRYIQIYKEEKRG